MRLRWFSSRQIAPLLLSISSFACLPSRAEAALIITSSSNTPTTYTATLQWVATTGPFEILSYGCGTAGQLGAAALGGCTPWTPALIQAQQFPTLPQANEIVLSLQHLVGPHGDDVNPGGVTILQLKEVVPGVHTASVSVNTPHNPHYDNVTLSVVPNGAGSSTITIVAEHLWFRNPEPSRWVSSAFRGCGHAVAFAAPI